MMKLLGHYARGSSSVDDVLTEFANIKGLDYIPTWPFGLGVWVLMAVLCITMVIVFHLLLKRKNYRRSWKYQMVATLTSLDKNKERLNQKELLDSIIQLTRQVGILSHGRAQCAALTGDSWLTWLSENDPKGFDWSENGKVLILNSYAPEHQPQNQKSMEQIIQALIRWVKSC